jgi:hypothetical protein
VTQELGGKSANIILDDADIAQVVAAGVQACVMNTGQSCNAPTRMLVPRSRMAEAAAIAKDAAAVVVVGDPRGEKTTIGPVVSDVQFEKIQRLIKSGIAEGAEVVTGGAGRPEGLDHGYYIKPTVFANVRNDMTIAREEIFGPVLAILPYKDEAEAIRLANETVYGLAAYVQSGDLAHARQTAGLCGTHEGARHDERKPLAWRNRERAIHANCDRGCGQNRSVRVALGEHTPAARRGREERLRGSDDERARLADLGRAVVPRVRDDAGCVRRGCCRRPARRCRASRAAHRCATALCWSP